MRHFELHPVRILSFFQLTRSTYMTRYASARNIATFEKLFRDPAFKALAHEMLEAFLPFKIAAFECDKWYSPRYIHGVGTFHDDVRVDIVDVEGKERLLEFSLLQMRPGNTRGFFKTDDRYESLKTKELINYGRRLEELCFLQFTIDDPADCLVQKHYTFDESPYELRFNCFQLPKFDLTEAQLRTERDHWLYWLRHDRIPKAREEQLIPLLDWKNWDKDWRDTYKRREGWFEERRQKELNEAKNLDDRFLEKPAAQAHWHWFYLEKQIGVLPNQTVKPEAIDLEGFEEALPQYAFPLFRQWTKNCNMKHQALDLTIENEQVLINDVAQVIRQAIIDLFDYDRYYLTGCRQEDAATYLSGFIQGGLGRHWYMEYVIKQSQEFKICMALRSLSAWMSLEDVASLQIDDIYDKVLREKVNLANLNTEIKRKDLLSGKGKVIEPNEGRGKVHVVIENLLHHYIRKISAMEMELFVGDISAIIPDMVLEKWVSSNRAKFLNKITVKQN
jgi:hypothetical protein